MAIMYGFSDLESKLIDLFRTIKPDFDEAEKLLDQGANINAAESDDGTNILSEILLGFWQSPDDEIQDDCEDDSSDESYYDYMHRVNPDMGVNMCKIIHFFLTHGFDVTACHGRFGAQCLHSLTYSTFDRYMIDGVKMLFQAGAINCSLSADPNETETPWESVAMEDCYQGAYKQDYHLSNIFEAVYQVYQAVEDGNPYQGIDSYEAAIGRKILKVLIEENHKIYFMLDSGILIYTSYGSMWIDTVLPKMELQDGSRNFENIIGNTIKAFYYGDNDHDGSTHQHNMPATILEMESGLKVKLTDWQAV